METPKGQRLDRLRIAFEEALGPVNLIAACLGAVVGWLLIEPTAGSLLGMAWVSDRLSARSAIGNIFGIQATILSIGLSLMMLALQNAAAQYSPRLLALFVRMPQVRWVIPIFAFAGTFDLTAVWKLGLVETESARPQPAVGAAFLLLFFSAGTLVLQILRTIGAIRIEQILAAVAVSASLSAQRVVLRRAKLRQAPAGSLGPPAPGARALLSMGRGWIVEVQVESALAIAAARGLRIRIERITGDWVERGDRLALVEGAVEQKTLARLARCFTLRPARSFQYDYPFALRLLADIGMRALSPAVNDPMTARMCLQQVERILGLFPAAGSSWIFADRHGVPRVQIPLPEKVPALSLAIDGIVRYGAADPEVLADVVALLRSLGTRDPDLLDAARTGLQRVREDARSHLDPGRARRLFEAIDGAEEALRGGPAEPAAAPAFLYAVEG